MPASFTGKTDGALNQINVTNGIITATPNAFRGILATETCVLTPLAATGNSDYLDWTYSGACATNGWVQN